MFRNSRKQGTRSYPDRPASERGHLDRSSLRWIAVVLTGILIVAGTWAIVSQVTKNTEKITDAQRVLRAAERAETAADAAMADRRLLYAETDYNVCLVNQHQDDALERLLTVSLEAGRPPRTPEERAGRRVFENVRDRLRSNPPCSELPSITSLTPSDREAILSNRP